MVMYFSRISAPSYAFLNNSALKGGVLVGWKAIYHNPMIQRHGVATEKLLKRSFRRTQSTAFSKLFMVAVDEDEAEIDYEKTLESTWDISGLKKEVGRLILRCHKKIGKASSRLTKSRSELDRLTSCDGVTMEELSNCPDVDAIELEYNELKNRLKSLNELQELLKGVKNKKEPAKLPENSAKLVLDLGVNDKPPATQKRGAPKSKGPKKMESFRKPYRRYYTLDNVEIRVGKQAKDNDELSTSPEHRAGSDWWLHAAGCPGSHVVIRSDSPNEEVIQDAATLAARQSKCSGNVIKVSLTRCRDVKKPRGAKAGLVQITGDVRTISVNMKEAEARLERLDETVLVN